MDPRYEVLEVAARLAHEHIESLPSRPVGAQVGLEELRARLGGELVAAAFEQAGMSGCWTSGRGAAAR